jgi:Zn-dependent peptidase ImmA (M78 family)/DNA-binding XRE family transcriptional regulator
VELTQIIAENIIRLLEENNLTQGELSNYLDISRQTLSNYLKGASTIDSVRLVKVAQFFDVPVSALLEVPAVEKSPRSPMLLRSVVRAHDPITNIESMVFDYLDSYEQLESIIGTSSKFLPEQHDLYINHRGTRLSINYELSKVQPVKFLIDDQLRAEIYRIADYQRHLLGLNSAGAIELIPALIQRGINVFFRDFDSDNIFGLSICDNSHGCCIFVNSNWNIPIERQLFTIAHEFAHIILHRPLFRPEVGAPISVQYSDFIDKMADEFAGRLLCPIELVYPYTRIFNAPDATLKSILLHAIQLKKKLHISLASLLVSLNRYGMISKSIISEYYRWANVSGNRFKEPVPISEDQVLREHFQNTRDSHIIEVLRRVHMKRGISANTISYFLPCDFAKATEILKRFNSDIDDFGDFI